MSCSNCSYCDRSKLDCKCIEFNKYFQKNALLKSIEKGLCKYNLEMLAPIIFDYFDTTSNVEIRHLTGTIYTLICDETTMSTLMLQNLISQKIGIAPKILTLVFCGRKVQIDSMLTIDQLYQNAVTKFQKQFIKKKFHVVMLIGGG